MDTVSSAENTPADEAEPTWEQAVADFEAGTSGEVVRAPLAITLIYQYLGRRWQASSPHLTGFAVSGGSLEETRELARDALGSYLDPAINVNERVWHPWQLSTQVAGVVLVAGAALGTPASGTLSLTGNTAQGFTVHGLAVEVSQATITGVSVTVANAAAITAEGISIDALPGGTYYVTGGSWPQTSADEGTMVAMAQAPAVAKAA